MLWTGSPGFNSHCPHTFFFPKVFASRRRLLRNAPSKGHHSRYITLFFKGPYSVIGFYEVMRMFLVSLMHFVEVILGIFEPFSLVLLV